MKNTSKLAAAAVLVTTSLTGCMTLRHVPVPGEQANAGGGPLPVPLQVGAIDHDVQHAGTVGALAQSRDIPGNDDLAYRFTRGVSRHLDRWAGQQDENAPMLNARIEYDRARSGSTVKQGLPGALTLGLIPIVEDGVFTMSVSVTSGEREVYRHQVQETIRSYMSILFPTPMLVKNEKDVVWQKTVDSAMARLHAQLAPWVAAEQEKFERDVAGTSARDQQNWLKQHPDSLHRGRILAFLAANPPTRDSLAWHGENIAAFDDYQALIPNEDAIWFVGPKGQRVVDIRNALRQGEDTSIIAARILAARHPYRAFDSAETAVLRKGGIPAPVIAAMIEVSAAAPGATGSNLAAVTAPPPDVARLVIHGNSGQYLCPWTSSGVVAPWMSKALANSDMGAAAGKALGSYAGTKAMENVPFIGRMLGEKLGEASGRSIALQAIGGEAYMRETSDLSFHTLGDMARYLQATYSSSAQYQQVIEAADEIYPGLSAAIAAAAAY